MDHKKINADEGMLNEPFNHCPNITNDCPNAQKCQNNHNIFYHFIDKIPMFGETQSFLIDFLL